MGKTTRKLPPKLYMFYDGETLISDSIIPTELSDGHVVGIYERVDVGVIKKDVRVELKPDRSRNIIAKKRSR